MNTFNNSRFILCMIVMLINNNCLVITTNSGQHQPAQATDFGVGGIGPHKAIIIYQGRQYVVDANQLFGKLQKIPPGPGIPPSLPNGSKQVAPSNGQTSLLGTTTLPSSAPGIHGTGIKPPSKQTSPHITTGGWPSWQGGQKIYRGNGQTRPPSTWILNGHGPGTIPIAPTGQKHKCVPTGSGQIPVLPPSIGHRPKYSHTGNGGSFIPPPTFPKSVGNGMWPGLPPPPPPPPQSNGQFQKPSTGWHQAPPQSNGQFQKLSTGWHQAPPRLNGQFQKPSTGWHQAPPQQVQNKPYNYQHQVPSHTGQQMFAASQHPYHRAQYRN